MAITKISVSVDRELLDEARGLAPDGNLSALIGEALADRVRLERMRRFLADEATERGTLPEPLRTDVRAKWPA